MKNFFVLIVVLFITTTSKSEKIIVFIKDQTRPTYSKPVEKDSTMNGVLTTAVLCFGEGDYKCTKACTVVNEERPGYYFTINNMGVPDVAIGNIFQSIEDNIQQGTYSGTILYNSIIFNYSYNESSLALTVHILNE